MKPDGHQRVPRWKLVLAGVVVSIAFNTVIGPLPGSDAAFNALDRANGGCAPQGNRLPSAAEMQCAFGFGSTQGARAAQAVNQWFSDHGIPPGPSINDLTGR